MTRVLKDTEGPDRSHKNRSLEKEDHGPYNILEANECCPNQMVDWASPFRSGASVHDMYALRDCETTSPV